jgi:hypothetical protein
LSHPWRVAHHQVVIRDFLSTFVLSVPGKLYGYAYVPVMTYHRMMRDDGSREN